MYFQEQNAHFFHFFLRFSRFRNAPFFGGALFAPGGSFCSLFAPHGAPQGTFLAPWRSLRVPSAPFGESSGPPGLPFGPRMVPLACPGVLQGSLGVPLGSLGPPFGPPKVSLAGFWVPLGHPRGVFWYHGASFWPCNGALGPLMVSLACPGVPLPEVIGFVQSVSRNQAVIRATKEKFNR